MNHSSVFFDKTLYASPYMVMTEQEYTKHYYIEGERVCTKIGGGFGPAPLMPLSQPLVFISGNHNDAAQYLWQMVDRSILCTGYEGQWETSEQMPPAYNENDDPEYNQYFYHSDHLGSASFITDATGYVDQHIQYLPFGELFISQRNGQFDSRYKFTAKELDNETNYTYFGARYYDSDLSILLSVDPLADKYPSLSPYMYCAGNPVMLIDPNGMEIDPTKFIENANGGQANYDLLEADLESKTGLNLEYHSDGEGGGFISYETTKGFLGRNKPVINKEGTSGKARRMLLRGIRSEKTLEIDFGEDNEGLYKKNLIKLNPETIQEQIDNTSSDLNNTTFGWALTYFHEFSHTPLGGQHKDPSQSNPRNKYRLGGAVRSTNSIRNQLGTDYGRRSMYFVLTDINPSALPFSRQGRQQIKQGIAPTEKYVLYK